MNTQIIDGGYESQVKYVLLMHDFTKSEIEYIFEQEDNQEIVKQCYNEGAYPIKAISKLILFKEQWRDNYEEEKVFTQR